MISVCERRQSPAINLIGRRYDRLKPHDRKIRYRITFHAAP
jgi:hypothetical protein